MSGTPSELRIRFDSNAFYLATDLDSTELKISTPLSLDRGSEGLEFKVVPLLRADLPENAIREVFIGEDRIGWIIPANALSSDEHDYAASTHFLKYAYETTREVLQGHPRMVGQGIERLQTQGATEATFADLVHDNVCFLTISVQRLPEACSVDGLTPSLISEGYLPYWACAPDAVHWRPNEDLQTKKLRLSLIGNGIAQPEVPIRMMTVAAAGDSSPVTQFFYLYQVIELLMEAVLRSSVSSIGSDIGKAIDMDEFQTLRDRLEDFQNIMSEKRRLSEMMKRCVGSDAAITSLERTAKDFLSTVGISAKDGILSLYQVRNFVVHRIRSMPHESEERLTAVVYEFARFLPAILANFEANSQETLSMKATPEGS